jgi:hypothetical protein
MLDRRGGHAARDAVFEAAPHAGSFVVADNDDGCGQIVASARPPARSLAPNDTQVSHAPPGRASVPVQTPAHGVCDTPSP